MTYQTILYKGVINDFQLGWETAEKLFQSKEYDNPRDAMRELNLHEPQHPNHFSTMVERKDGNITEEQFIDASMFDTTDL